MIPSVTSKPAPLSLCKWEEDIWILLDGAESMGIYSVVVLDNSYFLLPIVYLALDRIFNPINSVFQR